MIIEIKNRYGFFNPKEIRNVFKETIKGSNGYYNLQVRFIDGSLICLRYELNEAEELEMDYQEFKSKVSEYNAMQNCKYAKWIGVDGWGYCCSNPNKKTFAFCQNVKKCKDKQ